METINTPAVNILAIVLGIIISILFIWTGEMNRVVPSAFARWIPLLVGLSTLGLYFASRLFLKRFNWAFTAIGMLYLMITAIQYANS